MSERGIELLLLADLHIDARGLGEDLGCLPVETLLLGSSGTQRGAGSGICLTVLVLLGTWLLAVEHVHGVLSTPLVEPLGVFLVHPLL